jgi:hypothetical protein
MWLPLGIGAPGWTFLGGDDVDGAITCVSPSDDWIDIFGRATDGSVRHRRWTKGYAWADWNTRGTPISGDVAVVSRLDGHMDLFAVSKSNDALLTKSWNASTGWWPSAEGWVSLGSPGGDLQGNPVVVGRNSSLDVFVRRAANFGGGQVCARSWTGATGWLGWRCFAGSEGYGEFAAVKRSDNNFHLFVPLADGRVVHKSHLGGVWTPAPPGSNNWEDLGGQAIDVQATSSSPGRIDLVARAVNDKLRHLRWDSGTWR